MKKNEARNMKNRKWKEHMKEGKGGKNRKNKEVNGKAERESRGGEKERVRERRRAR